jgi:hypothetical protein
MQSQPPFARPIWVLAGLPQFRGDQGETAGWFEATERKIASSASYFAQEIPNQIIRAVALL